MGAGALVVVFSDQLVDEVCHQAYGASRRATAEVIDRLSAGVTLLGFHDRRFLEIRRWVSALLERCSPVPLEDAWTTLPHVYKALAFEPSHPDKELVAAFLKTTEDLAHRLGFRGIVDKIDLETPAVSAWKEVAEELSTRKTTNWRDQGSFAEIFREEALSYFDKVLADAPPEILSELKRLPRGGDLEGQGIIANAKRTFLACEQLALAPTSLPALRILAGGNCRIRAERARKFKPGDGADLFHAAAALPYCHTFLTDRSLRHVLTTAPTDFAKLFYGSRVLSSVTEAIQHLSRLTS